MIIERTKKNSVLIRYRDADGNRKQRTVSANPFCYIESGDIGNLKPPFTVLPDENYEGLYGEKLRRVMFESTDDMRNVSKKVRTWEANIAHTNKVLVENRVNIPMYEHRTWFFDMEWMMDSGQITIIVIEDSTDGEYVLFTHPDYKAGFYDSIPCKEHPEGMKDCVSGERRFKCFNNEKELLQDFARLMRKCDPDILTGWNVVNADCQQLFKRFKANGLEIRTLSPMRKVRYDFGEWAQPIAGYNTIDLMIAFKKLWTLKNGQLPAMGLGAVSTYCLKETKVDLKDGHDTYFTDIGTYLDYARQDVRLLPRLNDLVGALDYFTAVQHIAQCDIRTTPYVTKVFPILALRDEEFKEQIPSKAQFEKVDYTGADIMKVDAGVHRNIGIMDIKAMYHSNIKLHNICWTTLDDDGNDCGNGVKFAQKNGLLGRQMDKMTVLRNRYKELMKSAPTEKKRKMYDALQYATKSLVASMYGVAGDSKCGFYHPDIASAITFTSRQTLFRLRDIANELGCTVRYGHTDSIMCDIKSSEHGLDVLRIINERMSPIETEFEKWCDTFLIMAKNRYAASVSWTDGEPHDPQIYVKGIEMKQGRLPNALKSALQSTIHGILNERDEVEITQEIEDLVRRIISGDIPVRDLCIKAKLNKNLSEYSVLGEARAGAQWANTHLGKGYRKDDYFLTTLNNKGEYIAFDDPNEVEGIAQIGFKHIAQRFVFDKVQPYYEVMGWDIVSLENALNGLSGSWI